MRRILRWLAPLLIVGATFVPAVAQSRRPSPDASESADDRPTGHTPALQYTVAFLFVILVLVILCKPSRKA